MQLFFVLLVEHDPLKTGPKLKREFENKKKITLKLE